MSTLRQSKARRSPPSLRLKPWQWGILLAEAALLLGVLGALAWLLGVNAPAARQVAQAVTPTSTSPAPAPSHTPTPFAWPTLLPSATPPPTSTPVVSREPLNKDAIAEIEQQVAELRQLQPRTTVPVEFLTRAEMRDYARRQFDADLRLPQELALYRALGLIQAGVQIDPDAIAEMVASDIAGFYDQKTKRLYVVGDLENLGPNEKATLAHEYAHALEDQQFDLTQYGSRSRTTDAYLAAMAVPEGDATVVMSLYLHGNTTQSEWSDMASRAVLGDQSIITATGISARANQIGYFPYVQGAEFVATLLADSENWLEVNHAYVEPPKSTSQVMHPARYLTRHTAPVPIPLPDLGQALGRGWSATIKADTLGEFVTSVHLDEFLHDPRRSAQAADGWAGDSFALWQAPGGELVGGTSRQAFAWQAAWDTPRDAAEFFSVYTDVLRKRVGPGAIAERQGADMSWFSGQAGSGLVRRANDRTLVLWGPDTATVGKLNGLFKW
jgi:hypothetical protein